MAFLRVVSRLHHTLILKAPSITDRAELGGARFDSDLWSCIGLANFLLLIVIIVVCSRGPRVCTVIKLFIPDAGTRMSRNGVVEISAFRGRVQISRLPACTLACTLRLGMSMAVRGSGTRYHLSLPVDRGPIDLHMCRLYSSRVLRFFQLGVVHRLGLGFGQSCSGLHCRQMSSRIHMPY